MVEWEFPAVHVRLHRWRRRYENANRRGGGVEGDDDDALALGKRIVLQHPSSARCVQRLRCPAMWPAGIVDCVGDNQTSGRNLRGCRAVMLFDAIVAAAGRSQHNDMSSDRA